MIRKVAYRKAMILLIMVAAVLRLAGQDPALRVYEMRMNGNPYGALALVDSLLKADPGSAELWFERGRCYDWIKTEGCTKFTHVWTKMAPRLKRSQRSLLKACRLDPTNARYHYWAMENGGLVSLAAIYSPWDWPALPIYYHRMDKHARLAILCDPDNPEYRFKMITYSKMGGLGGGRKKFLPYADTLYKLDPVYGVEAYEEIETKKHPYDDMAQFVELERLYPDHPELMKVIMQKGRRTGGDRVEYVRYYAEKLLAMNPHDPAPLKQYYRVLPEGRKSEAIPLIEKYLASVENDYGYYRAAAYRVLSSCYLSMGQNDVANEYLAKANRLDPCNNSAPINDFEPPVK